jgi:phosphoglycolate phosphatase
MWDIDGTLMRGGGMATRAWQAAFLELTGLTWRETPNFGGRTDLDICAEVFLTHGVTDCTPERFFELYVAQVLANRHLITEQGWLLPGVREVLAQLSNDQDVVQTLVTGNHPTVAAAKVSAFGLADVFDAEVGGYGTDDSARATLVRLCLERASEKYGEQFRAVVVGDTGNDVAAALANDVAVVAVATGRVSADDLVDAGAHRVLADLSDLAAAMDAILLP